MQDDGIIPPPPLLSPSQVAALFGRGGSGRSPSGSELGLLHLENLSLEAAVVWVGRWQRQGHEEETKSVYSFPSQFGWPVGDLAWLTQRWGIGPLLRIPWRAELATLS